MRRSQLRTRLTGLFGLAIFAGLGALAVSLFLSLRSQADNRLTASVTAAATQLATQIEARNPARWSDPTAPVLTELSQSLVGANEVRAVYDSLGVAMGVHGRAGLLAGFGRSVDEWAAAGDFAAAGSEETRYAVVWLEGPRMAVVAARSKATLAAESRSIAFWLLGSVPLAGLFAILAGFALAGRAFRPFERLATEIDEIDVRRLEKRLSVRQPADEIDALAVRFNGLLDRLSEAQSQNRGFLADVAHQLKTPLTVVRGESSLALKGGAEHDEAMRALERIDKASSQMAHRVDDLLLLARAEAGERPQLTDDIELDGLALDCADMMRGRVSEQGHRLELARIEPAAVRGNGPLIREVLLELIENAVRHGQPDRPISVSAFTEGDEAHLEVASGGDPWVGTVPLDRSKGLGLSIINWIAAAHHGRLAHRHEDGANVFSFAWSAPERSAP